MTRSVAAQVADIEKAEKEKMRAKVENIISQGLNCFVNRQLIYNFPEEIFADAGVMAIEHADFDGIERLALVTGQLCCELRFLLQFRGQSPSSFQHWNVYFNSEMSPLHLQCKRNFWGQ